MTFKTRRKFLGELAFIAGSTPFMSSFKRPSAIPQIGFLNGAGLDELDNGFIEELKKLGFEESNTIVIERRFARPNTNDAAGFAQELAKMKLALIVVSALPFAMGTSQTLIPKCPWSSVLVQEWLATDLLKAWNILVASTQVWTASSRGHSTTTSTAQSCRP